MEKGGEVDYNESNYPAIAESESEGELQGLEAAQQSPGGEGKDTAEDMGVSLSDDVLCIVCGEVLVEPCTLHCGHSFCQLCLAALWKNQRNKTPLYLHCPVCRQPWVNFPGVNIQLRNIIEKAHKSSVNWRLANYSESDKNILAQYKRAKEGEWQKERQNTRQLRPAVWITAVVLFCGLVSIVLALLLLLVALAGGNVELVQKPVQKWDNDDVMEWLGNLGDWASDQNISRVFFKERITGAQLKLLNQSTLKSLGVHVDYFKTQSLLLAIEQLQQNEYVPPRNFNEFMAAHRKKTFLIGIMYKLWPRFTFLYVYLFEYQDIFVSVWYYSVTHQVQGDSTATPPGKMELTNRQVIVFGIEILLVPHYVVGLFAWHWINLHPWICSAVLIHCVWVMQSEAKRAVSCMFAVTQFNWKLKFSGLLRVFCKNMLMFLLAMTGGLVMWPIIPYFVCDGIFYLFLWNTVYTHIIVVLWRLITRRRRRVLNHLPHQQAVMVP